MAFAAAATVAGSVAGSVAGFAAGTAEALLRAAESNGLCWQPIEYMQPGENVLWRLHTRVDSDTAFHHGADISALSQFVGEDEILFPPMTMLQVLTLQQGEETDSAHDVSSPPRKMLSQFQMGDAQPSLLADGEKHYTIIDVLPCFL